MKHRGHPVAHRKPDLLIPTDGGPIVVELKANKKIRESQRRQLESYAAMCREDKNVETANTAVLINFGPDGVTTEEIDCGNPFDIGLDPSNAYGRRV